MTELQETKLQGRAIGEGQKWAQEKSARLKAQIDTLAEVYERQQELLSMPDVSLVAGIERWYSVPEAARFFNRTSQWMYDRIRKEKFRYRDGMPIRPHQDKNNVTITRIDPGTGVEEEITEEHLGPYRFNLPILREIAQSCYRDGTVKMDELKAILKRVAESEYEEILYDPDEE